MFHSHGMVRELTDGGNTYTEPLRTTITRSNLLAEQYYVEASGLTLGSWIQRNWQQYKTGALVATKLYMRLKKAAHTTLRGTFITAGVMTAVTFGVIHVV